MINDVSARVYDMMLERRVQPAPSSLPVLVGIDEASLVRYGQWPWPRYRLAALVEELGHLGAKVVALDVLMPEPDRTSPEILLQERARDLGETLPGEDLFRETSSNDTLLAKAISMTTTVLGFRYDFSGELLPAPEVAPKRLSQVILRQAPDGRAVWPQPSGQVCSIAPLATASAMQGFTNAQADLDGVLRKVPLLLPNRQGFSPSLAFAALLQASGQREIHLDVDAGEITLTWNGHAYLDYARQMVEAHHEKWDGSGYPYGLRGAAIPLAGRLMALADVYDALISKRVYKPAFPHEKAKAIILEGRGRHFDPDVVDAFLASEERFQDIAWEFADSSA